MAYTWENLKESILYKLSDPDEGRFTAAEILVLTNDALKVYASAHTPKINTEVLEYDGETKAFQLTETQYIDLFEVREGDAIVPRSLRLDSYTSTQNYYLRADGYLVFNTAPQSDITVIYGQYYDDIVEDTDELEIPNWGYEAISYYVASAALASNFQKFLMLNNFKTRVDSGDPEDSPTLIGIKYYMTRYYDILKQHNVPEYQEKEL